MRVLFVFPDLSPDVTSYTGVASYGIAVLSAELKRAGHEVALLHLTSPPSRDDFCARVRAAAPDLIAFSANSHYARRLPEWAAWARSASPAAIAAGGIHATLAPEQVSGIPQVDFTCVGEGESALLELCDALESGRDPTGIASIWARRGDSIVRNPVRSLCADLDGLPDPDLGLFDFDRLYPVRLGRFPYLMSRGCAYGCSYCCAHTLRKLASRASPGIPARAATAGVPAGPAGFGPSVATRTPYWRFLSPPRAAAQLATLLERHMPNAPEIHFLDAIFFPNREWLRPFAAHYKQLVGRPFSCNLRADLVDEEAAEILADMGCTAARLGVESGDEEITRLVLTRGLDIDSIRRAFGLLRAHGIARWSYNMVGLPTETLGKALQTVRLNAELDPELAIPFIFYPYPGTRLHTVCEREGFLTEREYDHYFLGVTTRLPTFKEADILFVHRFFSPLVRLYAVARPWPPAARRRWESAVTAVLTSPLFPRAAILAVRERYKRMRHVVGERLIRRSPALYRRLGGRAPGAGIAAAPHVAGARAVATLASGAGAATTRAAECNAPAARAGATRATRSAANGSP
jgi:anaerobic magnesium-protoporphyrin IX monomethyl ester cyclase